MRTPWRRKRDVVEPPKAPETITDLDLNEVSLPELDWAIMSHRASCVAMRSLNDWERADVIEARLDQLLEARFRMTGDDAKL